MLMLLAWILGERPAEIQIDGKTFWHVDGNTYAGYGESDTVQVRFNERPPN